MYLKTQESNAPENVRVEANLSVQFKTLKGEFVIYNRETKEKTSHKSIEIIPINDERFTIKAAESVAGEFIFSGIYRSAKQKIAVMKSADGKVTNLLTGPWSEIKDAAKSKGLKYTKLMYALVKVGDKFEKAIFDLQGISAIQWGDIRSDESGKVITLKCSDEKTYESNSKKFYQMEVAGATDVDSDEEALAYADEVSKAFKSEDARYKYYKNNTGDVSAKDDSAELEEDVDPASLEAEF